MKFFKYKNNSPLVSKDTYIANGARIIGDVCIKEHSSVWFNSVLRADVASIRVGKYTNIQDLTTVHVAREHVNNNIVVKEKIPCIIGDYVTIGHNCVIHACVIHDNVLVGMGSIIMDGAEIGSNSIVAAQSLVTKNKKFPPNSLIQGSPAKFIRFLDEEEIKAIKTQALDYANESKNYLDKGC